LLSFPFIYFSESGLFNGLRAIQIKKSILLEPFQTVSESSHRLQCIERAMRLNPANENVVVFFLNLSIHCRPLMAFAVDRARRPRCHGRLDVEKCGHRRTKYANTSELRPQKQWRSTIKTPTAGHSLKPNSRITGVNPRIPLRGRPGRTAAKTPGLPMDKQANR
jgi:hypothetical protein